jgi:xanthine dehydrogenase accessory factor
MGGVYDIAPQVLQWLAEGRDVHVATVVATRGFSSRDPGASAAWTPGEPAVGSLLEGVAAEQLHGDGVVQVTISEDDAVRAGLACGGTATLLVRPASAYPAETWDRLIAGEPVCLVTRLDHGRAAGTTIVLTPESVRAAYPPADEIPRLFARGTTGTAVLEEAVVVALWPVPAMVVVGDGLIAAALQAAGELLGWTTRLTAEVGTAVDAVAGLHASDALVVLSHDRAVDGPALAAGLASRCGYVGALGSRRTQAARRDWLTDHGVAESDQRRIHGPAGLDIDAHTPGEIAVSIVAEIIAARSGSTGGALRDRDGPVHVAGVQAPPPRY